MIKTLTTVAEYWLSDNNRSSDLQTKIAKGYLDLWGSAMRRLAGEEATPAIAPSPRVVVVTAPGEVTGPPGALSPPGVTVGPVVALAAPDVLAIADTVA